MLQIEHAGGEARNSRAAKRVTPPRRRLLRTFRRPKRSGTPNTAHSLVRSRLRTGANEFRYAQGVDSDGVRVSPLCYQRLKFSLRIFFRTVAAKLLRTTEIPISVTAYR